MVLFLPFCKDIWEAYKNLMLIGKILLLPIFFIVMIGVFAFAVIEIVFMDLWIFLLLLFSKDMSCSDMFIYWN